MKTWTGLESTDGLECLNNSMISYFYNEKESEEQPEQILACNYNMFAHLPRLQFTIGRIPLGTH